MEESVKIFNEFRDRLNERILTESNLQTRRFFNLDTRAYENGKLDRKTKEMLGLTASMVLKCDDCIKYHLQELHKLDIDEETLWEVFNIALIVGGSIVIPHLREAVDFWDALNESEINYNEEFNDSQSAVDTKKSSTYEIYTDGACEDNPGPGGYAALIMQDGEVLDKIKGSRKDTTNNRMELRAVIEGVKYLDENSRVKIYSDSQYVHQGLQNWLDTWKQNGWQTANNEAVKNQDLWQQLDELRDKYELEIIKVKAHNDNQLNEKADKLAKEAIPENFNENLQN